MLIEVKYGKHIQGEVVDFQMIECGGCGIPFFVPTRWLNQRIQNKGEFHCPNGCNRIFIGKTEAEKAKERIEQLKVESAKKEQELQDKWLDALGEKNKLERKLKRVHKGVCPCCNRTFINLQRHMKTKHPEKLAK